jgi:lipoprotein NlpI
VAHQAQFDGIAQASFCGTAYARIDACAAIRSGIVLLHATCPPRRPHACAPAHGLLLPPAFGLPPRRLQPRARQLDLCTQYGRASAYWSRGISWRHKGEFDRAIADFDEAIRIDTKPARSYLQRAYAWDDKGDWDRAIADYDQAIRLDPKHARAHNGRGWAFYKEGELDRAIAGYTEAIRLDPKFAWAYNNRGLVWRDKGDFDRAIADFTEVIKLDPKYGSAYDNRGLVWRDKGELDRAIADFTEAIRLDPKAHGTYLNRGLTYLYRGDPAKALADVNQASELDPKYAYHALWVDIVGQRNGLASRLEQAMTKLDMTKWPAPVLRLFLGQSTPAAVLAAADDPDANKKKGQVCEANFYGGILALRKGAKDEATKLYRLAADGCPRNFMELYAANAELKQLAR